MPQKETLVNVVYTCMLLYFIVVSHLSFNFLCLLLLYSIYLCGKTHRYCTTTEYSIYRGRIEIGGV